MTPQEYLPIVTTILSIGTVIGPILFGFVIWRMSKIFVSRDQFDEFREVRKGDQSRVEQRLDRIEADIKIIMRGHD